MPGMRKAGAIGKKAYQKPKRSAAEKLKRSKRKLTEEMKGKMQRPEWAKDMSEAEYRDIIGSPRMGKPDEEYGDVIRSRKKGGKVGKPLGCGKAEKGFGKGPYKS